MEPNKEVITEELTQFVELLKRRPDFNRFPWPKEVHEKFNIPVPTIPTLKEYLDESKYARFQTGYSPEK